MSILSFQLNLIYGHFRSMCVHDRERLRKILSTITPPRNPCCSQCQDEEKRQERLQKPQR